MFGRESRGLSASMRVLLAMTSVLAFTVFALVAIAYVVTFRALTAENDRTLVREAKAFSAAVRSAPGEETLAEASRAYFRGRTSVGGGPDPLLLVVLPSGRAISNSEIHLEDAAGNDSAKSPPSTASFSEIRVEGVTYRTLTTPVLAKDGSRSAFQAALSVDFARRTALRLASTLSAGGMAALALGVLLSFWATKGALRPLSKMAEDAATITPARPGGRIAYQGPPDELASLARTLNEMLDRLETAADEQRRFVADASHELRTPLAIIRGNLDLMETTPAGQPPDSETLHVIEDEIIRMTAMLDELLALARFDSNVRPAFQPIDACALIEEVRGHALALGATNVTASAQKALWVAGDADLLRQALMNLVTNAIAHTPKGGAIRLVCEESDGRVVLHVIDSGPGLSDVDLEHCFDRFYRSGATAEARGEGSGLGLAITKRVVELHGGSVSVRNAEPSGADFAISLPSAEAPPTPS